MTKGNDPLNLIEYGIVTSGGLLLLCVMVQAVYHSPTVYASTFRRS